MPLLPSPRCCSPAALLRRLRGRVGAQPARSLRRGAALLLAGMLLTGGLTVAPARAAEPAEPAADKSLSWLLIDQISPAEQQAVETALLEDSGEIRYWPDWLEIRLLPLPTRAGRWLLVRLPFRYSCGGAEYLLLAPPGAGGVRQTKGERLCGDGLAVLPQPMSSDLPDFVLARSAAVADDLSAPLQQIHLRLAETGDWLEITRPARR